MQTIYLASPEVLLSIAATLILLLEVFRKNESTYSFIHIFSLSAILIAGFITSTFWHDGIKQTIFNDLFINDPFSNLAKMFLYISTAVTFIYGRQYAQNRGILHGEYYCLALASLIGQMFMVSSQNMMTLYLGLELQALSLYAMVALRRDHTRSIEAAMKYFVLGALSSGLFLFGISLIYGATGGALDFATIANKIGGGHVKTPILIMGLIFLISGMAFKLGVVPFHMWVPDVYHGAPTVVTLFIATGPKIAAFAMIVRTLVQGLPEFGNDWRLMLAILAILSLILGNLAAIGQDNLKRMLAYSGISHMGFVLLAFMAGRAGVLTQGGIEGVGNGFYYISVYALTTLATFGLILAMSKVGFEADRLDDLKGLNQRNPWLAFLMLLMMFSLAGIPPMVGFYAKFAVINALVESNYVAFALLAVLFSLIGAFYYLRVVKLMYFDKPVISDPIEFHPTHHWVLTINSLALIILGVFPSWLINITMNSIHASLQYMGR